MLEKRLELRRYFLSRFGSTQKAFRAIDPQGIGHLSRNDLAKAFEALKVPWIQITGVSDIRALFQPSRLDGAFLIIHDVLGDSLEDLPEDGAESTEESDSARRTRAPQRAFENPNNVKAFAEWAATNNKWDQIHELFHYDDKFMFVTAGVVGRDRMTAAKWDECIKQLGFKGDAAGIFREIVRERNMSDDKHSRLYNCEDERISLRQLKRFEDRARSMNAALRLTDEGSPGMRFLNVLRKNRGTILRAWRLDLDVRGTGRVAYVDFSAACRKLKCDTKEVRAIWDSIRQDRGSTPLEFHELAPEEASNMEAFCKVLWDTVGLDLEQAWNFMDESSQNVLRWDDFKSGAARLGFTGDTQLLFKGLDSTGLGHVWRDQFEYLESISRTAQHRLRRSTRQPGRSELITWVQRELGGADVLIVKLGLSAKSREITVSDLAARLTALGFPGDALYAATRAARSEGGTSVSADALYAILNGSRMHRPGLNDSSNLSLSPSSPRKMMKASSESGLCMRLSVNSQAIRGRIPQKQGWKDGIDDFAEQNREKASHQRTYFSVNKRTDSKGERDFYSKVERPGGQERIGLVMSPRKDKVMMDHRASTRNNPQRHWSQIHGPKNPVEIRPEWDNALDMNPKCNLEMPPACRKYFSSASPLRRAMAPGGCDNSKSPDPSPTTRSNGSPFKKSGASTYRTPGIHMSGYDDDGSDDDDGVVLL